MESVIWPIETPERSIPQFDDSTIPRFHLRKYGALPNVEILSDFTGITPDLVRMFADRKPDGLVIRTFAGGRLSTGMQEGLKFLVEKNIPIVMASRVLDGRIVGKPEYSSRRQKKTANFKICDLLIRLQSK